ncbi:MAG: betaine--homocysteine S-methyltransferase [Pseudomonadota bacterium]
MQNPFSDLLAEKGYLLADGATGTNLFNMGLMSGDAPEFWNEEKPDNIRKLYRGSIDAGSDLFLTNSFGANASRLKLHDAGHRAYELSKIAAELGREEVDKESRTILVAGSVGPTGEIMGEAGTLSHETAVEMFEETAKGLMDGGADILYVETISAIEEFKAVAEAFGNINAPWLGTMSFDTAGRTMMGLTSENMVELVNELDHKPTAFGANCGVGASDLLRTILGMTNANPDQPLIAKANAGIPKYVDGNIVYDGTPELMADYAVMVRNAGATVIGGCCGTLPEHLAKMRIALDENPIEAAPDHDEIQSRFGSFSSETDGTGCGCSAPKRRPRRRRRA